MAKLNKGKWGKWGNFKRLIQLAQIEFDHLKKKKLLQISDLKSSCVDMHS
jgi:hypothetical protein